jgi:hypothetical protein
MDQIGMLSAATLNWLQLLVTLFPLAAGLAYWIRPTEQLLALMRPLSLAGIFNGLGGAVLGLINALRSFAANDLPIRPEPWLVVPFVAFACLTIAWLFVAIGMRRCE